jgi:hypothetical protein
MSCQKAMFILRAGDLAGRFGTLLFPRLKKQATEHKGNMSEERSMKLSGLILNKKMFRVSEYSCCFAGKRVDDRKTHR